MKRRYIEYDFKISAFTRYRSVDNAIETPAIFRIFKQPELSFHHYQNITMFLHHNNSLKIG